MLKSVCGSLYIYIYIFLAVFPGRVFAAIWHKLYLPRCSATLVTDNNKKASACAWTIVKALTRGLINPSATADALTLNSFWSVSVESLDQLFAYWQAWIQEFPTGAKSATKRFLATFFCWLLPFFHQCYRILLLHIILSSVHFHTYSAPVAPLAIPRGATPCTPSSAIYTEGARLPVDPPLLTDIYWKWVSQSHTVWRVKALTQSCKWLRRFPSQVQI